MITKSMKHVLIKYLFKELLVYFSIAFLFFFLIFFINQLLFNAEQILSRRVPVSQVLLFILYSLPAIIAQSAPFATLVGFLMCLGRMVSDNEILILRATGHSFFFLLIPTIALGLLISFGSFFVNDFLLPRGAGALNRLYLSIISSNPAVELESQSIKRYADSTLVIGNVEGQNVSDLMLFDTDSSGQFRIISAANVLVDSVEEENIAMQLNMNDAKAIFFDMRNDTNFDYLTSTQATMNLFISNFIPSYSELIPSEMTFYDLGQEIKNLKVQESSDAQLINIYELEYHKKFSLPFGSIFFAFLAFPISLLFGKHNGQTIGLIIGICICVLYWALLIIGQQFGLTIGFDGFTSMWLPNFLVLIFAVFFLVGLIRK